MTTILLQRAIIFIGAALISLFIAEYAIRFTQPELNPNSQIRFQPATKTKPVLGPPNTSLRQIKNTGDYNVLIKFNESGFRDKKNIAEAKPNDFVLVGDSFTFGWGVQEKSRITEQLEAIIRRPVFNISIPTGFDGYDRLLDYAKQRGAKLKRVIIAASMETDLHLYQEEDKKIIGAKEQKPRGNWLMPVKGFLATHSALYALSTTLIHRTPLLKSIATKLGIIIPNLEGIRKYEFSQAVINSSAQRLKHIAEKYDTTILVIPSRALWHGNFIKIENRRHQAFVQRLNALKLDVLDLKPIMERNKNPLSLHFKNDPHWLASGHKLAAQALANHLRKRYGDL
ncbi:MAG: alginate O-acetyltransferase AlgX-related protein [Rhodospirillales bacterium]|jgi:hypothetical protein